MTQEEITAVELQFGEYWVKTDKTRNGEPLYELWGSTRWFDGENWVELT